MVELQKELSIKEIKYNIKDLEAKLNFYLTKKAINFNKTQPGAIIYKDVVTNSGMIFDKFTHYVIKDNEFDAKIYELTESILAYQTLLISKLKAISELDETEVKIIIDKINGLTYQELAEKWHYSERQLKRICNKY